MRAFRLLALSFVIVLIPLSALALEGIGPRVTVTGAVEEIFITQKQSFDQEGGTILVRASNGQLVTVVLAKDTEIISEGRLSRKQLIPANITKNMQVRVRGWRVDSKTLTASLFIILNIQTNPSLSTSGTLQAINEDSIQVLTQDGKVHVYQVTNETDVNISFALRGMNGLTFIGKQVLLTLNPTNSSQVRVIRMTGN
jgi:hypothetical protein